MHAKPKVCKIFQELGYDQYLFEQSIFLIL